MQSWLWELKSVVLVILVSEFLKELLTGERFKKYIQFAVTLFLFCFLLSTFFHTDFSLPQLPEQTEAAPYHNYLPEEFAAVIQSRIAEELSQHQIFCQSITVTLSETYEIQMVHIETDESPEAVGAVLKGEFPYEVVCPSEG